MEVRKEVDNENGWFVSFQTYCPALLMVMMVEDVKDGGGSSGYVFL